MKLENFVPYIFNIQIFWYTVSTRTTESVNENLEKLVCVNVFLKLRKNIIIFKYREFMMKYRGTIDTSYKKPKSTKGVKFDEFNP